jgi:WD40 repeat protein
VSLERWCAGSQGFSLQKTFKGHLMSVSNVAIHPKKPIVATASDDCTWKMWSLPEGEIIMSGDGHKDWVAGVNFHPKVTTATMRSPLRSVMRFHSASDLKVAIRNAPAAVSPRPPNSSITIVARTSQLQNSSTN